MRAARLLSVGFDRLLEALAACAGLIVAATTLAVAADVVSYSVGLGSISWSADLAAYGLLYGTLMGAPWLLRERGHVTIDALRRNARPGVTRALGVAVGLLSAAVCLGLAAGGAMLVADSLARGAVDYRAIAIPRWALYLPLPFGFALLAVEFLRGTLRPPEEDAPPSALDGAGL